MIIDVNLWIEIALLVDTIFWTIFTIFTTKTLHIKGGEDTHSR